MIFKEEQKSQPITRLQVWEAFKEVARIGGSHGVDGVTIEQVKSNPRKYLYPLWNRMASGSYFPKAVRKFTDKKHILLYVERWLKVSVQQTDGTPKANEGKGTPQGGVISPLLANIFLHFAFDKWFEKTYPQNNFERYADDIIIHCTNIKEALRMLEAVKQRLKEFKLEINQRKSKIVYCRRNQKRQPPFKPKYQKFDFLGYTFKPRVVKERGKIKIGFSPAISRKSQQRIGGELFKLKIHRMVHVPLSKIAVILKAKTHGWINYYGKFRLSEMRKVFRVLNMRLARMVRSKYRRFRNRHWYESYKFLKAISKDYPTMFAHWEHGFRP